MFTLSKLERDNFFHLYTEIFAYGIFFGTSLSFWGVYAAHLGATPFQIGLLSSGPGLVNLILSLPSVLLLEKSYPERATFFTSILNRVVFTLLILLPFLHSSSIQIWSIVLVAIISAVPGTVLTMGANLMLAEVIPMEWRAVVIGRRSALLSVSITISLLLSGLILDWLIFPLNYQVVFAVGLIGAAISSYHLGRIVSLRRQKNQGMSVQAGILSRLVASLRLFRLETAEHTRAGVRNLLRIDILRTQFGPFILSYLIFYTIISFPIPIYTLFLVQTIQVSDGVISLGNSIFYVSMILLSLLLARMSRLLGHHKVLVVAAFIYILYPLVGSLAKDAVLFYLASFFGGAAWGLANGALINRLFERTPEDDRPACMAHHNLALNLGTLAGVLIGSAMPEFLGLRDALFISGVSRVIGALVLLFWG